MTIPEHERSPILRVTRDDFCRLIPEARLAHVGAMVGDGGALFFLGSHCEWTVDTREFLSAAPGTWVFIVSSKGLFVHVADEDVATAYWLRFGGA